MELARQRTLLLSLGALLAARLAATAAFILAIGVVFAPAVVAQADSNPPVVARIWTGKLSGVRAGYMRTFQEAMRELGHTEGRNYVLNMHFVSRDPAKMKTQIVEILRGGPALLMTSGTPVTLAAKQLGGATPIVMATVGDPVRAGIVDRLSGQGGKVTGISNLTGELYVKRLDIVRTILPGMTRIGYIWNPRNLVQIAGLEDLREIAGDMGIAVKDASVHGKADVAAALAKLKSDGVSAIIVPPSIHVMGGKLFREFAIGERMPLIYDQRRRADTGAGLFSYGANLTALYRRAAFYVSRILAGEDPATLPIEQPTEFEFVVNLNTAKALGISIPPSVLLLADAVIE